METQKRDSVSKHIAGVIPVANVETEIEMIAPLCLAPISNGFTLLQRSVLECAYAGCKTIWIVCSDVDGPLIKRVCGDFVVDPYSLSDMRFKKYPSENVKYIPIFYVPVSYKNSEKRGIGVSVVEGVLASFSVSSKMSKWLVPERYYVSSPYGVYDPTTLKGEKTTIKKSEAVFLEATGASVLSGNHIGFSFGAEKFKHCNYLFKRMPTKENFTLDKIFNNDIMKKNSVFLNTPNYQEVVTWQGYESIFSGGLGFEIYPTWKNMFDSNYINKKG